MLLPPAILLGIKKASLNTQSFISEASYRGLVFPSKELFDTLP
jgi:hypothetical protein